MNVDGYVLMVDVAAKFFNNLRVEGWFHHPSDRLRSVSFTGQPVLASQMATGLPHEGVSSLGPDKGFQLSVMRQDEDLPDHAALVFTTDSGWSASIPLADLCRDRILTNNGGNALLEQFRGLVAATPNARLLDLGGRARSEYDRSQDFPGTAVSVLDILPGENVDIVADAHDMTDAVPPESFDGLISVSVFEHLLMPWTVVGQINRILKPGGVVLITTHQCLAMHDAPWDFWRFSDTAWDALFNRHTGFDIIGRSLGSTQFVVPHIYTPIKAHAERSAGFELSVVLARKTGPCTLAWPLTPADLTATMYPAGTENPFARKD